MNITKDSKLLLSFLVKDDNINYKYHKPIGKSKHIFKMLYNKLSKANSLIKEVKASEIIKITNPQQIVKPKDYDNRSFPLKIIDHINKYSRTQYLYTFSLFSRSIKVYFIEETQEVDSTSDPNKYAQCFRKMLLWFYILNSHASKTCSQTITVYIYLSSLKKEIPSHSSIVIDQNHANTGFTRNCVVNSEIVIFREEEWFKVFLHESFHNFSLDFSDMNINHLNKQLLQLFPSIHSEVNLYESYTEFWAEIMNAVISSYLLNQSNTYNKYLEGCDFFINCERNFSIYQLVKVLKHMNLTYNDIIKKDRVNDGKYKENTSVLSYYILKNIILNNYNEFLVWCYKNNTDIFQFVKSEQHLQMFYKFIEHYYNTVDMIEMIQYAENMKSIDPFICKNMRMTCIEIK